MPQKFSVGVKITKQECGTFYRTQDVDKNQLNPKDRDLTECTVYNRQQSLKEYYLIVKATAKMWRRKISQVREKSCGDAIKRFRKKTTVPTLREETSEDLYVPH